MNYGGNFNQYPNIPDTNYNLNPNMRNYNQNCNMCKGTGLYMMNGMNVSCTCSQSTQNYNLTPNTNYNSNMYTYPMGEIYDSKRHHPHHKNIFSRTMSAISNCISCGGRGFMNAFTGSGHQKVCYECIRANGYCPQCNNTGYKVHNGKRCKCGLFN